MNAGWNVETGQWDWGYGYRPDPYNMYWTGASAGFLAMGIFNWFLPFIQLFIYVYFIVGITDLMNLITTVMSIASFDPTAVGAVSPVAGLEAGLKTFTTKLSWGIPAGLVLAIFLNTSTSWWVMIYHTGTGLALDEIRFDQSNTQMHMYWVTVKGFFYSWWILGWAPALLMTMEWILATAGDATKYTTYHYILILGTWGFWLMTAIVNTWAYSTMQWGWEELMILRSYMNVAIENGEIDIYCSYYDEGCVPGAPALASASAAEANDDDDLDVPEDDSWNVMSAVAGNGVSFHY